MGLIASLSVLPTLYKVIIGLVPSRDSGELRAWKARERVKEQSIEGEGAIVGDDSSGDIMPGGA